jgi:asparagine synthetase B (glutamine-hydrolysing)
VENRFQSLPFKCNLQRYIQGAPDLIAAKKVADALGTIHHEVYFTPEVGLCTLESS